MYLENNLVLKEKFERYLGPTNDNEVRIIFDEGMSALSKKFNLIDRHIHSLCVLKQS
jgi:hypothetical protein